MTEQFTDLVFWSMHAGKCRLRPGEAEAIGRFLEDLTEVELEKLIKLKEQQKLVDAALSTL